MYKVLGSHYVPAVAQGCGCAGWLHAPVQPASLHLLSLAASAGPAAQPQLQPSGAAAGNHAGILPGRSAPMWATGRQVWRAKVSEWFDSRVGNMLFSPAWEF
jgi:hypothetical protein